MQDQKPWNIYLFDSSTFWYDVTCGILNKQQQIKDSTLQNGILGQSTKNTDKFMFSFEWLKRDWRP